jgi:hypothetical protein
MDIILSTNLRHHHLFFRGAFAATAVATRYDEQNEPAEGRPSGS